MSGHIDSPALAFEKENLALRDQRDDRRIGFLLLFAGCLLGRHRSKAVRLSPFSTEV